jgi:hypothetical protein
MSRKVLRAFIPDRYLEPPLRGIIIPAFGEAGIIIDAADLGRRLERHEIKPKIIQEKGAFYFMEDQPLVCH